MRLYRVEKEVMHYPNILLRMIRSVIKSNNDKHLIDAAVKHSNSLLVTFRCEEGRKVIMFIFHV